MTWLDHWRALAARIDGIIRAGEFLVMSFNVHNSDNFEVFRKSFLPEFESINIEIKKLGENYSNELPQDASEAIKSYIKLQDNITQQRYGRNVVGYIDIQALAPLASFRFQFEYYVRDSEVEGRNLTELAFEHLRRQLVVDEDIRSKWQNAFNKHETTCEKLGAVHLLSHGIWAFKVVALGGATDLVFGDQVSQHSEVVRRTARALVLTEWKLVRCPEEITTKAREGREQAAIYSGGILGDVELKRTRYVVLVCEPELTPPDDVMVGAVTYRHIILPIKPKSPSATARSRKGRKKSQENV